MRKTGYFDIEMIQSYGWNLFVFAALEPNCMQNYSEVNITEFPPDFSFPVWIDNWRIKCDLFQRF